MAWGMTDKSKNKLEPAELSSWGGFLWLITKLDKASKKPEGWHWLIALHYLLGFDIKKIQKQLPDEHPLKATPLPTKADKETFGAILMILNDNLKKQKKFTKIDFSGLLFNNEMNFSNFIFPIHTDFSNAAFSKNVYFSNAIFFETADFKNTAFRGKSSFENIKFSEIVEFSEAAFLNDANFSETVFFSTVNFYKTAFFRSAFFLKTIFSEMTIFRSAEFSEPVYFNNAHFKGHSTFVDTKFKKYAPAFYSVKIDTDITLDKNIKLWPPVEKNTDEIINEKLNLNQHAYENLAGHMERLDKYHDRHFFFRQEMRCRRRLEGVFNFIINGFYELLANYGYGVERAFLGWLFHMCFWAGILFFFAIPDTTTTYKRFACSVLTSASNAHSFLLSRGDHLSNCYSTDKPPLSFDFIWAMETIFGAFFLFLLLLTLRTRFRLK